MRTRRGLALVQLKPRRHLLESYGENRKQPGNSGETAPRTTPGVWLVLTGVYQIGLELQTRSGRPCFCCHQHGASYTTGRLVERAQQHKRRLPFSSEVKPRRHGSLVAQHMTGVKKTASSACSCSRLEDLLIKAKHNSTRASDRSLSSCSFSSGSSAHSLQEQQKGQLVLYNPEAQNAREAEACEPTESKASTKSSPRVPLWFRWRSPVRYALWKTLSGQPLKDLEDFNEGMQWPDVQFTASLDLLDRSATF